MAESKGYILSKKYSIRQARKPIVQQTYIRSDSSQQWVSSQILYKNKKNTLKEIFKSKFLKNKQLPSQL